MSCFRCPPQVVQEMNKCCRTFFGGSDKNPPISWKDVCLPKDLGGLRVRLTNQFNLAALAKLKWKCLTDHSNWWVKIVTQKYLRHENFFTLKKKSNHYVA